ncbi:MAG: alpha-glucan family phosphorylase, partial [Proteobacteria bacterium]|nr:alpha-glucan family phosphorylase [Pseudomonadota bacterium]
CSQWVPEFYDRGDGVPHGWIKRMKESMKTAFKQYGTHRMVRDYISDMYLPTLALAARRNKNKYALAKDVGTWQRRIPGRFSTVNIKEIRVEGIHGDVFMLGNTLRISAKVDKGQLLQEEMLVELIVASPGEDTVLDCKPLKLKHTEGNNLEFRVEYTPASSGTCRYGIRVIPVHPGLGTKYETRLIRWS